MNRPKATRLRLSLAVAAIAAFAVIMPSAASADIVNSGPSAATGSVTFADPTPGAHSNITITQDYSASQGAGAPGSSYSGVPSGVAANTGDDLKQWILDTPAGFYGNPSAIPFDERCTIAQKNNYVKNTPVPGDSFNPTAPCPTTSIVGSASLVLGVDASSGTGAVLSGTIYEVQSPANLQEVPTTLFTVFTTVPSGGPAAGHTVAAAISTTKVAPVTSGPQGDYRLRSVSDTPIDRPDLSGALLQAPGTTLGNIKKVTYNLLGTLPNGNHFQTNPSRCGDWKSTLYAASYGDVGGDANQTTTLSGTAADAGDTSDSYLAIDAGTVNVSCAIPRPALSSTPTAAVTTNARNANPGLVVAIANPNADERDRAAKLVTTLPSSLSINVAALNNICSDSDLQADTCPTASQVGTAKITSPMISQAQNGRVYMTKGSTPGLPFLSIWVEGAFKFRLDATTKFVGPLFNEIETTFSTLPQLPFDQFDVTFSGGSATSSLLYSRACPTDGSTPNNGPITFSTLGWGGSINANQSALNLDPCYGINNPSKINNCVKQGKQLKVTAKGVIATSTISKVQLLTGSKSTNVKTRATVTKSPYSFKLSLKKSKYKKGTSYKYAYKVWYKDGNVIKTKTNSFKTCK